MCHTTTSGEMTKFSLSTWECYTRTEEKCGLLNFSTRGLAVVVKTNSSTRGCAACGEFAFTTPAKPLVGNLFVPIRGFAAHREKFIKVITCLLYTSPSPRDRTRSRMPSSA